jgi:hypothetical protein
MYLRMNMSRCLNIKNDKYHPASHSISEIYNQIKMIINYYLITCLRHSIILREMSEKASVMIHKSRRDGILKPVKIELTIRIIQRLTFFNPGNNG